MHLLLFFLLAPFGLLLAILASIAAGLALVAAVEFPLVIVAAVLTILALKFRMAPPGKREATCQLM